MFSRVSVAVLLAVLLALVGTGAAAADGPVQWADWPEHPAPIQLETLARFYEAAEYHGLRDADRDLLIRLGYRETLLGLAVWGDCYGPGGFCYSAGALQFHQDGIYRSTPCYAEYGLAGRLDPDVVAWCGAWAIKQGYVSHWRPDERVRWLRGIPADPRLALWGGPHPAYRSAAPPTLIAGGAVDR